MESSTIMRWMVKRRYKNLVGDKDKLDKQNPNGNASMCTDCKICVEKCPQQINIPVELTKVNAILGNRDKISNHYT